jgi:hypothetical protein
MRCAKDEKLILLRDLIEVGDFEDLWLPLIDSALAPAPRWR